MKKTRIKKLAVSAMMLALAFVLSYISVWRMPFGGSVTLFSMLPICFISVKYGIGWGLGTAFCYSWLQILQGEVFAWGLTPQMLVATLLLDYIAAFTVLGLAGMFRRRGKIGIIIGTIAVCVARFLVHFISGIVLWANLDKFVAFGETWVEKPALYSLCYNGAFMLPETLMTVVGIILIVSVPQIAKIMRAE